METKKYLEAVLTRETLEDDSPELQALRKERKTVEELIQKSFADSNPSIRYGGSKAKGTMIKSSYDLDVTVYFKHDDKSCGDSLEDVFNNVTDALSGQYLPIPKNAAIRLESGAADNKGVYTHIDVVPGRRVSDDEVNTDVFLHQTEGEKARLKTNLDTHIEHIRNSGLQDVIKLAKLWKVRQGLQVKTFVLDLLVIKVLDGRAEKSLEENLTYLWEQLRDNADNLSIEDPANPEGNDLSGLLASSKHELSTNAHNVLELTKAGRWEEIFGDSESLEESERAESVNTYVSSQPNMPKPYSQ